MTRPENRRRVHVALIGAVVGIALLAPFLGGSTERWSQAYVLICLSILFLVRPPRRRMGAAFNLLVVGIVLTGLVAFLPANWFSTPRWRTLITQDLKIELPSTLTPQPLLTLESLVLLIATTGWTYYLAAQRWTRREHRLLLRLFAGGVLILSTLSLYFFFVHKSLPFWISERNFGPFPHRNATANFFAIAGIVVGACAYEDFSARKATCLLWLIGLLSLSAGLVVNYSRAGIIILVVGLAIWFAWLMIVSRRRGTIIVGGGVVLGLVALFLKYGGETLERFSSRPLAEMLRGDFRWAIWRDALSLGNASPWPGIGLGNIADLLSLFRDASFNEYRAVHPASDWLWMRVEMGWPAVVMTGAASFLLLRDVFPLSPATNRSLRAACAVCGLLFVLHGVIDIPAHRMGAALPALFVASLALHLRRDLPICKWTPWLFRLLAIVFGAAGVLWLLALRHEVSVPSSVAVRELKESAIRANQRKDFQLSVAATTEALKWEPLNWELYFLRGTARAVSGGNWLEAWSDFYRARGLEATDWEVPFREGKIWIYVRPTVALNAWAEAVRRATDSTRVYHYVLDAAENHHELREGLREIAAGNRDREIEFLASSPPELFAAEMERFRAGDEELSKLSADQLRSVIAAWWRKGNERALVEEMNRNRRWQQEGWESLAQYFDRTKQYQNAYQLTRQHTKPPPLPHFTGRAALEERAQGFSVSQNDFTGGYALFCTQMQNGDGETALSTLRSISERPGCPKYFLFLEAELKATRAEWEEAWKALERYRAPG